MRLKNSLLLGALVLLTACNNNMQAKTPEQVKSALEKAYQEHNLKVQSVKKSPVKGLYEVVFEGNEVYYVDENAAYLIEGSLIDLKAKKNITADRVADLRKVNFADLPLQDAIVEVRGSGKNKVVVFNDIDCPFCRRLEHEFAQLTDLTIYTLLMPVDGLHPEARARSEQVWCNKDRAGVWTSVMRENKPIPQVEPCETPIERTLQLAHKLGFTGTPTLVFPNGKIQAGYAPAAALQEAIAANQ
ncbi:MAG: DsbC family protein [Neisseriaceae bacterium]|nr:DsbC family protein [Neisseriaceae bacterium]